MDMAISQTCGIIWHQNYLSIVIFHINETIISRPSKTKTVSIYFLTGTLLAFPNKQWLIPQKLQLQPCSTCVVHQEVFVDSHGCVTINRHLPRSRSYPGVGRDLLFTCGVILLVECRRYRNGWICTICLKCWKPFDNILDASKSMRLRFFRFETQPEPSDIYDVEAKSQSRQPHNYVDQSFSMGQSQTVSFLDPKKSQIALTYASSRWVKYKDSDS